MLACRSEDLENQTAWDVLHQVQCDLGYFLQETDSCGGQALPKHALDMMLKRTVCEIQRAKDKIQPHNAAGQEREACPEPAGADGGSHG
jgi:hypothetical protein